MDSLDISAAHSQGDVKRRSQRQQRNQSRGGQVQVTIHRVVEEKEEYPNGNAGHPRLKVEPSEDGCLLGLSLAAGYVLRAHHLKGKCDGGSEHQ